MKIARMPRGEYETLDAVNATLLGKFRKSAKAAKQHIDNPPPSTAAQEDGILAHLATLEPSRFASEVVVFEGARRAGKEWESFAAKHEGKYILKTDERAEILAKAAAVRNHPEAREYLKEGEAELAVRWDIDGVPCKSRLDFLSTSPAAVVDLKFTRNADPRGGYAREFVNFGTALPLAFYADAVKHALGESLPVIVIACEHETLDVVVYEVPEDILDLGRSQYRRHLQTLLRCRETGVWPGYADKKVTLQLPPYAFTQEEQS